MAIPKSQDSSMIEGKWFISMSCDQRAFSTYDATVYVELTRQYGTEKIMNRNWYGNVHFRLIRSAEFVQ